MVCDLLVCDCIGRSGDARRRRTVKFDAPATAYVIRRLTAGSAYQLRIKTSSFLAESAFTDFIVASVLPPGNSFTSDWEKLPASAVKLEFHGADTDTDTDILARIVARMSVSVSVSVSAPWNASLTALELCRKLRCSLTMQ